MQELVFFEGTLPSAFRYNFEPYLFNREEYRLLQSATNWTSCYILNELELTVEAHFHFYGRNDAALSSIQSPFGGMEWSRNVDPKTLFHFLEFVCEKLRASGIKNLRVSNPPNAYDPGNRAVIETLMLNQAFEITTSELSSVIVVSQKPFHEILHPRKRRKLTQSLESNLQFRTLHADSLDDMYTFIEAQRKEKSYQLSVSREHLKHSVSTLGNVYKFFGVFEGSTLVAASIAVLVSREILYHFISDHIRKAGEAKPVLVLMNGIYDFCVTNNIKLLDLGTSAKDSQPNFKLINFKTEIGGQVTQKNTFTKKLL